MADVKWIKIAVDIFDDEKILLVEQMPEGYAIITVWFKLLCLAGKQNNSGVFVINEKIPYTEEMFATIFRMPLNIVRLALTTFERFGMVEIINETITIPKWGKHQSLGKIEKQNEYMRQYMADYREKQKRLVSGESCKPNSKVNSKPNVNALELEEELNIKSNGAEAPKHKKFVPPTLQDVALYCQERKNSVNPSAFLAHYEANGWVQGRGKPIKDWKAAVRVWENSGFSASAAPEKQVNVIL